MGNSTSSDTEGSHDALSHANALMHVAAPDQPGRAGLYSVDVYATTCHYCLSHRPGLGIESWLREGRYNTVLSLNGPTAHAGAR